MCDSLIDVQSYENDLKEQGLYGQQRLFFRNKFLRFTLVWEIMVFNIGSKSVSK